MKKPWRLALCALCLITAVWLTARYLLPIGLPFLLGWLVSRAAEPAVKRLTRRGCPRWLASFLCITGVLAALAGVLWLLGRSICTGLTELAARLPGYLASLSAPLARLKRRLLLLAAHLPDGMAAFRRYGELVFARRREADTPLPCVRLRPGEPVRWGSWTLCLAPEHPERWPMAAFLAPEGTAEGLFVRPRVQGDVIALPGGRKSLKRFMIDRKIPQKDRDRTPVLCDNKKIRALFWDRVYTVEKEKERAVIVAAGRDEV